MRGEGEGGRWRGGGPHLAAAAAVERAAGGRPAVVPLEARVAEAAPLPAVAVARAARVARRPRRAAERGGAEAGARERRLRHDERGVALAAHVLGAPDRHLVRAALPRAAADEVDRLPRQRRREPAARGEGVADGRRLGPLERRSVQDVLRSEGQRAGGVVGGGAAGAVGADRRHAGRRVAADAVVGVVGRVRQRRRHAAGEEQARAEHNGGGSVPRRRRVLDAVDLRGGVVPHEGGRVEVPEALERHVGRADLADPCERAGGACERVVCGCRVRRRVRGDAPPKIHSLRPTSAAEWPSRPGGLAQGWGEQLASILRQRSVAEPPTWYSSTWTSLKCCLSSAPPKSSDIPAAIGVSVAPCRAFGASPAGSRRCQLRLSASKTDAGAAPA